MGKKISKAGIRKAIAVLMASSMAFLLVTGRTPGWPVQTGQILVLGVAPNLVEQPQNILLSVKSWAWISRPITVSYFMF